LSFQIIKTALIRNRALIEGSLLCFSCILLASQCAAGKLASSADTRYSMRLGNPQTFKTAKNAQSIAIRQFE
jgi:hypothetical protein